MVFVISSELLFDVLSKCATCLCSTRARFTFEYGSVAFYAPKLLLYMLHTPCHVVGQSFDESCFIII